jgi:hypothetical protein
MLPVLLQAKPEVLTSVPVPAYSGPDTPPSPDKFDQLPEGIAEHVP